MKHMRLLSSVALVSLLAACGGGGGMTPGPTVSSAGSGNNSGSTSTNTPTGSNSGSSSTGSNTGSSTGPTTSTVPLSATTANMDPSTDTTDSNGNVTPDPTGGSILSGSVAQSDPGQAGTIVVNTDANGKVTSMSFASGPSFSLAGLDKVDITDQGFLSSNANVVGATMKADGSDVQPLTLSNTSQLAAADIAKAVMTADQDPTHPLALLTEAYSYSAFGVWSKMDPSSGLRQIGVFAGGAETPVGSMPTIGTATYSGNVAGFASIPNPNYQKGEANAYQSLAVNGIAGLNVDFGKGTVGASFTGLTTQRMDETGTTGTLPSLTGSGTVSGNTFATNLSGGGLTGSSNGKFYGSAAQEAAGTFQASGNGTTVIAAFGAQKQ